MFTGLISSVGEVVAIERRGDLRMLIACDFEPADIPLGASIACAGACLTVVAVGEDESQGRRTKFAVDVSAETLARTTLGTWQTGTNVNLERSLRVGDELGGHLVYGHVDGVARIAAIEPSGDSLNVTIAAPAELAPFIAGKGSIALDGVSLTINDVAGSQFTVNIIPHTRMVTTWANCRVGDRLNLEVDMLARYVVRLKEHSS